MTRALTYRNEHRCSRGWIRRAIEGCVRSRKTTDLHPPIEEGHISCALVHLANASYRLGRALRFDPETEQVVDDEEANRLLSGADRGYRAPFLIPSDV